MKLSDQTLNESIKCWNFSIDWGWYESEGISVENRIKWVKRTVLPYLTYLRLQHDKTAKIVEVMWEVKYNWLKMFFPSGISNDIYE